MASRPDISEDIAAQDDSEQISSEQSGSTDQQLKVVAADSETDVSFLSNLYNSVRICL